MDLVIADFRDGGASSVKVLVVLDGAKTVPGTERVIVPQEYVLAMKNGVVLVAKNLTVLGHQIAVEMGIV